MEAVHSHLPVSRQDLQTFCQRWHISEFAIFGSAAREDFRDDSDIDVMVQFEAAAEVGLWELVRLQRELQELLGRPVDVVEKGTIRNPYRRTAIERDLTVVYAA
jgi:predicted nucleotidyltransferase